MELSVYIQNVHHEPAHPCINGWINAIQNTISLYWIHAFINIFLDSFIHSCTNLLSLCIHCFLELCSLYFILLSFFCHSIFNPLVILSLFCSPLFLHIFFASLNSSYTHPYILVKINCSWKKNASILEQRYSCLLSSLFLYITKEQQVVFNHSVGILSPQQLSILCQELYN